MASGRKAVISKITLPVILEMTSGYGGEFVDLDREGRRAVTEEGVPVAQALGRFEVGGLDNGVAGEVTGVRR
jgi:hypothetical protein